METPKMNAALPPFVSILLLFVKSNITFRVLECLLVKKTAPTSKPVRKDFFRKKQHLPVAIQGRNLKPLTEMRYVRPVPILMK